MNRSFCDSPAKKTFTTAKGAPPRSYVPLFLLATAYDCGEAPAAIFAGLAARTHPPKERSSSELKQLINFFTFFLLTADLALFAPSMRALLAAHQTGQLSE